jgi:hypothetical protein
MLLISLGSVVYADFIMSAQLVCTANINSGSPVIEITGWAVESTNTIDADDDGTIMGDELKIESVTDGDGKVIGLNITANPIFPDWYLNITVDIHNTIDSIPVNLNRTIFYWNSTVNDWVETYEDGLLSLFRIRYSDEWYNATTGEPIPDITTLDIWPCRTVTTLESLTFDGQNYPELQRQTFCFMVVITATYPENGG